MAVAEERTLTRALTGRRSQTCRGPGLEEEHGGQWAGRSEQRPYMGDACRGMPAPGPMGLGLEAPHAKFDL